MTLNEIAEQSIDKTSKTNIILDSQVLTTLMACGRLTDFRFNHNLQSLNGKSNSLECGSVVHKFLETYYGCQINGIKRSEAIGFGLAAAELYIKGCPTCTGFTPAHMIDGEMTTTIRDGHVCNEDCKTKPPCGHRINDFPGIKNTPAESEGYKIGWKHVLTTCEEYSDYYKNEYWVPLEVEVVKSKVLFEDDEIRILWKAKLDLITDTNQGILPVDHKTMKQRRNTTKLNNQFKGQCLIMGTRNVIINKVGFQKTLPPAEKFERAPISYSAPVLIEWQSQILPYYAYKLIEYNETGYWPPNYNNCENKYGDCVFRGVCESDPEMREEEIKLNFYVGPEWNPTNEDE